MLARAAEAGDLLVATDLVEAPSGSDLPAGALRVSDVVGMEAARRLPSGRSLRAGDVIRPQLVRRGEPVTISVRDGPLVISATGRALASGTAGAIVRVVAQATGRTLDAEVEGPAAVRIRTNAR